MLLDELKTVIEVAHRNGVKVTAHNGSPAAADDAIALGIDCFEHGYYLGRKQLQAMKDKGIWLCPTIGVSQASVMEFFRRQGMPEWYLERVRSVNKAHWATLQDAIRIGVNIAMGTDQNPAEPNAGTTATIRELEMYVEAGMTPLGSLRTATSAAAEMLRLAADVGSLSARRFADIVAMKQNPLENIAALRTINFVMKGRQIANTRVTACLFDEQVPLDDKGYFTTVASKEKDRPRNARTECGIGWLRLPDEGDGLGDPDISLLLFRHTLADPNFTAAAQNLKDDAEIIPEMGEYLPESAYMMKNAIETIFPCPIKPEKRN
jgi:Amidohydrolase family